MAEDPEDRVAAWPGRVHIIACDLCAWCPCPSRPVLPDRRCICGGHRAGKRLSFCLKVPRRGQRLRFLLLLIIFFFVSSRSHDGYVRLAPFLLPVHGHTVGLMASAFVVHYCSEPPRFRSSRRKKTRRTRIIDGTHGRERIYRSADRSPSSWILDGDARRATRTIDRAASVLVDPRFQAPQPEKSSIRMQCFLILQKTTSSICKYSALRKKIT